MKLNSFFSDCFSLIKPDELIKHGGHNYAIKVEIRLTNKKTNEGEMEMIKSGTNMRVEKRTRDNAFNMHGSCYAFLLIIHGIKMNLFVRVGTLKLEHR